MLCPNEIKIINLFVVEVECRPLQPLPLFREELDEEVELEAVEGIVSNSRLFTNTLLALILWAANSVNKSLGTLMNNSLGTLFIKKDRTQGAILWVLGFL